MLQNFISFSWDYNGGSTRKEHLQMLVLKSKEKWWDDECTRPLTLLKLESTTDIDQVHKFQNSDFKEYPWKAATVLQKSMYFIFIGMNHWMHRPWFQYRLFKCIKSCFYYIRRMCRAVNERSYWLIEMNIKKTLLPSALNFLVLNLVEEAVLHYAGLYKSALWNK